MWRRGPAGCPRRDKPSAITSNLFPSVEACVKSRSKSRKKMFVETRAPPSRQTCATAFSTANPLRLKTPTVDHAALWWPKGSNRRPQEQRRTERGKGKRRRRKRTTRKGSESILETRGVPATLPTERKLAGHSETGLVPVRWNSNRATKLSLENARGLQRTPPSATRAVALWGLVSVAPGCLVGPPLTVLSKRGCPSQPSGELWRCEPWRSPCILAISG